MSATGTRSRDMGGTLAGCMFCDFSCEAEGLAEEHFKAGIFLVYGRWAGTVILG